MTAPVVLVKWYDWTKWPLDRVDRFPGISRSAREETVRGTIIAAAEARQVRRWASVVGFHQVWQKDCVEIQYHASDFFHLPTFVSHEQLGAERPWAVIVLDKQSQFVLSNEMLRGEAMPEAMWEYVVRSMAHPGPRDPIRPSVVEVSDSDCYDFLKPKLGEFGIECVLADELPELHTFCRTLAASYGGPEKCALADGPRVTMEQMESFYYAAARYFEQAPWKQVRGETPIEIRCRDLFVGTRYAIVLGARE